MPKPNAQHDQASVQRFVAIGTIVAVLVLLLLILCLLLLPNQLKKAGNRGLAQGEAVTGNSSGTGQSEQEFQGEDEHSGTPEPEPETEKHSGDDMPEQDALDSGRVEGNGQQTAPEDSDRSRQVDPPREPVRQDFTLAELTAPRAPPRQQVPRQRGSRSELDKFGNPTASDAGLAKDGEFSGKSILVWVSEPAVRSSILPSETLWAALRRKGFIVTHLQDAFDLKQLRRHDQFWLFAGSSDRLSPRDYEKIIAYAKQGKGLYVVADNDPFVVEANQLAQRMYRAGVCGYYQGDQIMEIEWRGQNLKGDKYGATFTVHGHPLLTGINFLYEGITISHIEPVGRLDVVLNASDKQPLVVVHPRDAVVFDCGFTRYYPQFVTKTAGTVRYAENIAAWLAGKRSP